jgi:hypothetical protein
MQRAELEEHLVDRMPLAGHVGKSGASLERWLLDDGTVVVVKRLTPETDLLMSLTHDQVGREYALWSSGLLDHLPEGVGHAIVGGWRESGETVVVMRDLGDRVLTWDDRLSAERCRWVMRCLAAVHRSFHDASLERWPQALTPLPAFISMFSPERLKPHLDDANPLPRLATRGWQIFEETVSSDVVGPVLEILHRPTRLATALRRRPCTLVHGDVATVNMAIESDLLVLLDWSMPALAPGPLDVARFVAGCASVVDLSREEIIDAYAGGAGAAYDETAMRLCLLSAAVWLGWNKALDAHEHPDPLIREREREDLDWWVSQARRTIRSGLL